MRRSVRSLAAVAAVAALGLAACSGGTNSSSSADAEQTYGPGALPTVTEGKLTVATSDPAYSPWILNNDPASGEGYESAVIYALAEELGYSADNVQWVRATFESSITPGAKDWDLNIQQFSITDERRNAVDFTSPYYTTSEAIIAKAGPEGRPDRRPGGHDVAAVRVRHPGTRAVPEAADVQLLRRHGSSPADGPRGRDRR